MEITNELYPTVEQQKGLGESGPDGPIFMLNMLKFREHAAYEDGSDSELSGRAAYQRYGAGVAAILGEYGARVAFAGNVTSLMIGQSDELWDEVALVEYPNRGALVAMISSPEYAAVAHHRKAGLEGQLNIETTGFAGFQPQD